MTTPFKAIGFDLGDTLIYYPDVPLSWVSLYPAALRTMANACALRPPPEQIADAAKILSRYNTRITPRAH